MDLAQQKRANAIFNDVVDLPAPERQRALAEACGEDADLRALVEELIALDSDASPFDDSNDLLENFIETDRVENEAQRLFPGAEVDRYTVQRLIGSGGTAQVWEVRHNVLETRHALKVLIWSEASLQRRLLKEARAQARLTHRNIVQVSDILTVWGSPGLLMPLIEGPPLDELLRQYRPTTDEAVGLIRGIAAGVSHAHQLGFIHRDLKPANVLLDLQEGEVVPRVADFGLVKGGGQSAHTHAGAVMGTVSYAAPEQLMDSTQADAGSDLWSLGVIFYELLTGRRPFSGWSIHVMQEAQLKGPDLTDIPETLAPLVTALLTADPSKRLSSCTDLLARLPSTPPLQLTTPLGGAARELTDTETLVPTPSASPPDSVPPARLTADSLSPSTNTQTFLPIDEATAELEEPEASDEVEEPPATPSAVPAPSPPAASRWWLVPAAMALLAAGWLGSSLLGGPESADSQGAEDAPTADVAPVEVVPEPVVPAEEPPAEEPLVEAPPAEVPVAEPAEEPSAEEPAPTVVAPEPTTPPLEAPAEEPPAEEPPAEEEPAAAPAAPATITITGNMDDVRIIGPDGTRHSSGTVPPGRYRIEAWLPDRGDTIHLSLGELGAGDAVTVKCSADFGICSAR